MLALLPACDAGSTEPAVETPAEILLSVSSLELDGGDTTRIQATVVGKSGRPIASPSAGTSKGGAPQLAWSTSDPAVATVDGSGLVAAQESGIATITASSGALKGSAKVNVRGPKRTEQKVAKLSVSPDVDTLNAIGKSVQLAVKAVDEQGNAISSPSISWSSLKPEVASVDGTGKVVSKAAGVALIVAASGSVADTAAMHVRQVVASVSVSPSSASLTVGDSTQLAATARDSSGVTVSGVQFSFSSSSTAIATVSSTGVVKGVAAGSATITASAAGKSASFVATVAAASVTPPTVARGCSGLAYDRLVPVSSASQLASAIQNAKPGDLIQLADGVYTGQFRLRASGTQAKRISLCGSRKAILDGGSITSSLVVSIKADYWTLSGFSVRNGLWAILGEGANHNIVRDLEVSHTGQEAVAFRVFSSHNVIEHNWIHTTGRHNPQWGEAVYLGSWSGHWCERTNCQPDRSDYNQVLNNTFGPNVTVESVDGKQGTTGGIIRGNTFNGIGMGGGEKHPTPAWIELQGNDYVVENNTGVRSTGNGMEIWSSLEGWGQRNIVRNNNFDLQSSGHGFRLGGKYPITSKVHCNNAVKNAGSGFSNITCAP